MGGISQGTTEMKRGNLVGRMVYMWSMCDKKMERFGVKWRKCWHSVWRCVSGVILKMIGCKSGGIYGYV